MFRRTRANELQPSTPGLHHLTPSPAEPGLARCSPYQQPGSRVPDSDLLETTTCKSNTTTALVTSRSWDYGSRLRSIANVADGVTVTSRTYAYDSLNRRIQAALEDGSTWTIATN